MQCTTLISIEPRLSALAHVRPSVASLKVRLCRPTADEAWDLQAAETMDRCTPWPTHRIRCFLQSQAGAPSRASR